LIKDLYSALIIKLLYNTAQPIEPTKRSLRVQTWKKIQEGNVGIGLHNIFNRIPSFVDADKAAALLINEEEFKKARKKITQPDFYPRLLIYSILQSTSR